MKQYYLGVIVLRNLALIFPLLFCACGYSLYNGTSALSVSSALSNSWIDTSNLVAYWQFDDNPAVDGGSLLPTMGSTSLVFTTGEHGVNKSTVGLINGGITFDGATDTADNTPISGFPNSNADQTISIWYKSSVYAAGAYLVLLDNPGTLNQVSLGFNNGVKQLVVAKWTGTILATSGVLPQLDDGTWHHVVYTQASGTHQIYLDAVQVASNTVAGNAGTPNTIRVGYNAVGPQYFQGVLDELSIWARALSATEIQTIYNRQK